MARLNQPPLALQFASISNVGLLSEQQSADVITVGTRKTTVGKPIDVRHVSEIAVHSESRHFDIAFAIDPPCEVSTKPIYSITNSEQGFERIYQQLEISCSWNVVIEPDGHVDLEVRATAIGQMVEPEAVRPTARRRRPAPTATPEAARLPRR